jgi:hypothetical protein
MPYPGSPKILKGALVHLAAPGAQPAIIVFPYNPETLCRTIVPAPAGSAAAGEGAGPPQETIMFTLALDATDSLGEGNAQAEDTGVYPVLSAIELLMGTAATAAGAATLFVWGEYRIVPVRVAGLRILERLFNPNLSPIQVSVEVTLLVIADPNDLKGSPGYLQTYNANLATLASSAYTAGFEALGITKL